MKLKRLGHGAICLQNIDKAAEFYQNIAMSLAWKGGVRRVGPLFVRVTARQDRTLASCDRDRAMMEACYQQLQGSGVKVSQIHEHQWHSLLLRARSRRQLV